MSKYNESQYKIYLDCVSIVFIAHDWNVLWVVNVNTKNCMMKLSRLKNKWIPSILIIKRVCYSSPSSMVQCRTKIKHTQDLENIKRN